MAAIIPKAVRSMRILALPLTWPNPRTSQPQSFDHDPTLLGLTYYHFQLDSTNKRADAGIIKWVTTKAAQLWASLGKGEEGSWKVRAFFFTSLSSFRIVWTWLANVPHPMQSCFDSLAHTLTPPLNH